MRRPARWAAIGLVLWLGGPASLRAAEPAAARGERLLQEGVALLDQGDAAQALPRLEEAYRAAPGRELLFQLGRAALLGGRALPAADLWRRYQEEAGDTVPLERRAVISEHLSRVLTGPAAASEASEVTLSGDSGALVSVDGRLVGALPLAQPLLLQAGAHQLRFERGARKVETQVALPARRQAELRVTFAPPVALLTLTPLVLVVEEVALPPALAAALAQVLAAALAKERALPIAAAAREAAGRRAPALLCQPADQPCLLRLAERLGAQLLLRLQAQPEPPPSGERGGALWLSVTVVDVAARAPAALLQRGLPLEAGALLAQEEALRRALREALTRPQGLLRVESEPPAEVRLDDVVLGETPLRLPAFLGSRRLELRRAAYEPYAAQVAITEGNETALRVALRPLPPSSPRLTLWVPPDAPTQEPAPALLVGLGGAGPRRAAFRRPLGITLLTVGGLGILAGAVAFGLDGYQSCALASVRRCPEELNGWPGGAVALSLGVTALVSGGLLLWLPPR